MKRYKLGFEIGWNSVSYSWFQSQKVQNMSYPAEISLKSYKTSRKRAGPKSIFLAQCNPRRDRKMCWNSIILQRRCGENMPRRQFVLLYARRGVWAGAQVEEDKCRKGECFGGRNDKWPIERSVVDEIWKQMENQERKETTRRKK